MGVADHEPSLCVPPGVGVCHRDSLSPAQLVAEIVSATLGTATDAVAVQELEEQVPMCSVSRGKCVHTSDAYRRWDQHMGRVPWCCDLPLRIHGSGGGGVVVRNFSSFSAIPQFPAIFSHFSGSFSQWDSTPPFGRCCPFADHRSRVACALHRRDRETIGGLRSGGGGVESNCEKLPEKCTNIAGNCGKIGRPDMIRPIPNSHVVTHARLMRTKAAHNPRCNAARHRPVQMAVQDHGPI